jgi:hypothetical protein
MEQGKRFPPRDVVGRSEDALGPGVARVLAAAFRSLTRKAGLAVHVRDSKDTHRGTLTPTPATRAAFTTLAAATPV